MTAGELAAKGKRDGGVSGGAADAINNLENVYIQNPSGGVTIVVAASNIAALTVGHPSSGA